MLPSARCCAHMCIAIEALVSAMDPHRVSSCRVLLHVMPVDGVLQLCIILLSQGLRILSQACHTIPNVVWQWRRQRMKQRWQCTLHHARMAGA
jgi:hypothetical protein